MSTAVPRILDDPRPISAAYYPQEGEGYDTRHGGRITKIVAYPEAGMHADLTFLAVYIGDTIFARVPAHLVTIVYAEPEEA